MSDRLAEIEARLDAAFPPAEWVVVEDAGEVWVTADDRIVHVYEAVDGSLVQRRANAALAAHAPTDLRDLLAVAKAARRLMETAPGAGTNYPDGRGGSIVRVSEYLELRESLADLDRFVNERTAP